MNIPGSGVVPVVEGEARSGRGLIGLVRPGGTLDDTLREVYTQIAKSPQMAKSIDRYNRIARWLGQRPSATAEEIAEVLGKDVTFSRIGNVRAGTFVPGEHPGATKYWIQGTPGSAYGGRVARHELVHLGAALRGQGDTFLHEIAVQAATTPEGLVAFSTGLVVVIDRIVYWIETQ